ncbi:CDP-alcohol phosphatidyltransferase family protein [Enterococcus sp. MMGLQ5-2]|uniref:CDP-alcohol phosphatidyltransferase family protein n=1 Tax=unclassified Enterococcus TaxID=2608891 RepID=UPI0015563775|nr:CDP-alcohol phosphatidyltransferase family protein [Enterococcus sp. MMGLQ5-2]MBS7584508.1 CDP-alcohol phosphatidyltransferase family protein [Enterococcus sp. MMGLQ5-1]NPD12363.1 CDP-alcohol phosphatidyltransferase family protein [Enterococcus sp. MMGLQ5-1]NPD36879.1 CDP-alcohol phosphatidyltransferase family protein [Enterococcus sp. MMGLQ5-2]
MKGRSEIIRNLPNLLTSLRILFAASLLAIRPFSIEFYLIYALCGLSDVLDGLIARRFNYLSRFGQIFDSIADLFFIVISLVRIVPVIKPSPLIIYWICIITMIRLLSIIIGFIRYQQLAFLHTLSNKFTGLIVFFFPFLIIYFNINTIGIIVCIIATFSALEELVINSFSKKLQRDLKSIFHIK